MKILGVLLAGGQSQRFGSPKAFAKYHGHYFYEISLNLLQTSTDDVVIVSHPDLTERFLKQTDMYVTEDEDKYCGNGPLVGIYTAMKQKKATWYLTLPCDTPHMKHAILEDLLRYTNSEISYDAIIPISNNRMQPLIGLYHERIFPLLHQQLDNKALKVQLLLDKLNVCYVQYHDHEEAFRNINTKDELEQN